MSYIEFKNLCTACWKNSKHEFIVIDKDSELNCGKYRRGFDCFINIGK